ncbi:MAG: hypothetical protein HZA93_23965 [Verrucomicrobia bacterium]|nr:hypothetical protein [Verrucomicrobiota bacterium]
MQALAAAEAAAKAGTPAVVRAALLGQAIQIGDVTVPSLTLGHVLLLEEIKSPLVHPGSDAPNNEQIAEALFALNRPANDVLRVRANGPIAWREAVYFFAATIPIGDMPAIGAAIGAQLARAESTVIGSGSARNESPASSGEDAAAVGEKKSAPAAVISPAPAGQRTTG